MEKENKSKKRSFKKIGLWILAISVIIVGGSYLFIQTLTYGATPQAQQVSQEAQTEKNVTFYDSGNPEAVGIIFYPGAFVKPESYSLWAQQIADAGHDVYVMHFPLNLAVLGGNRASEVQEQHPEQSFVLAGHSLGGVMASRYVVSNAEKIVGMIFMASYSDEKGALNELDIPVLSITGSKDGVLNQEAYESGKQFLPAETTFEVIEGGNHAGFGSYGAQKGDDEATIPNENQQEIISQLVLEWLAQF